MMEPFLIGLCIGLSIFVITSIVVVIRRRQEKKRYPGQVLGAPVPVTSTTGVYPGTHMQVPYNTTAYQIDVYAAPYSQQGSTAQTAWPQQPTQNFQPYAASYQAPYQHLGSAANINPPSYNTTVNENMSSAAITNSPTNNATVNQTVSAQTNTTTSALHAANS